MMPLSEDDLIRRALERYDNQSDLEALAEAEYAYERPDGKMIAVPTELVRAVMRLLDEHERITPTNWITWDTPYPPGWSEERATALAAELDAEPEPTDEEQPTDFAHLFVPNEMVPSISAFVAHFEALEECMQSLAASA
jgi:hypothetical protein